MRIRITSYARNSFQQIYLYHSKKDSLKKANKLRRSIEGKILFLLSHPKLGQIEENLAHLKQGHRYLVEKPYKIIYRIIGDIIYITDIFDTRKNPVKMKG